MILPCFIVGDKEGIFRMLYEGRSANHLTENKFDPAETARREETRTEEGEPKSGWQATVDIFLLLKGF